MATRRGARLNLDTFEADILDTDATSKYFNIKDFNPVLTGGKNAISLAGSELLQAGSPIDIEVLDVEQTPLFVQVGTGKKNVQFRDGVSIVVAVHVQSTTPTGNGKLYIVGTAADGRSVKWEADLTLAPTKFNKTKVRFFKTPTLTVEPRINESSVFANSDSTTTSGSCYSIAVAPKCETNFLDFDNLRKEVVYKIVSNTAQFDSRMEGEQLEMTEVTLADGVQLPTTYSVSVGEVLTDTELLVSTPLLNPNTDATKIVKTFKSANYKVTYTPILPVNQAIIGGNVFNKSLANITLKNIRTFTGNVHRFKIYRKSFNTPIDSETVANSLLATKEVLADQETADRQRENLGIFPDQDQVNTYWFPRGGLSLTRDATNLIDGMNFGSNPGTNTSNGVYVIAKDDTTRPASGNSTYEDAIDGELLVRTGSSWDSNFMAFSSGVEYVLKAKVYDQRSTIASSNIEFYLTGSQLDFDVTPQYDSFGINLGNVTFETNVLNTFKEFETSFTLNKDVNCTFIMVPHSGHFTVSDISIQPRQEFGFSPDILDITIPFDISVANERFLISAELFDVDHNNIPVDLEDIQFFDPTGLTLSSSAGAGSTVAWNDVTSKPAWVNNFPNVTPLAITASGFLGTASYADFAGTASCALKAPGAIPIDTSSFITADQTSSMTVATASVALNAYISQSGQNATLGELVVGDITIVSPNVPLSTSSSGNIGEVAYDTDYIYTCVSASLWKRSAIAQW
ncbi:MAG: hypothetical protein ACXACA_00890 [Candidatus Ranarchaeia archaeon]|jgi:hypothetical protein